MVLRIEEDGRILEEPLSKPVYWRNRDWAVTSYGMEPIGKWDDYCIEADRLGEAAKWCHNLPDWPLHMAEKGLGMRFLNAFAVALLVHKGRYIQDFREGWYLPTLWRVREDMADDKMAKRLKPQIEAYMIKKGWMSPGPGLRCYTIDHWCKAAEACGRPMKSRWSTDSLMPKGYNKRT